MEAHAVDRANRTLVHAVVDAEVGDLEDALVGRLPTVGPAPATASDAARRSSAPVLTTPPLRQAPRGAGPLAPAGAGRA